MAKRRKTRTVTVGNVKIGFDHPVSIQSMTKTDTTDVEATVRQISELEEAGCEIVRVAVKDSNAAKALKRIKQETNIAIVADIHFDYRLALEALESGADKIRINPGNIRMPSEIEKVIDAASARGVPIRIGVNSGSLPKERTHFGNVANNMVSVMLDYLEHFRKKDFNDIILSLKASDVPTTIEAYRKIADKCDYPLHLGVTAAGLPGEGIVKSSIGIGSLLLDGIGDTIRVSLTGDPVHEIHVAKRILSSTCARNFSPGIISCPTCGRCEVDLVSIVKQLEKELRTTTDYRQPTDKQLVIAVMGCEVNGPGEAKDADIGIAFGKGRGTIFRQGQVIKTVEAGASVNELLKMIKEEI
ncbi:MAG: flavodoxin-dependent (E)-4-hydroxy-3-methylbut-2-enyl-diphosphate synthase [Candidatus Omnitrophota bacterium]